ncbi:MULTISPECIES: TetR family transcriptional regulator [unclassified Streptomyces]|uniref:TetR/AcrR family transcriptional regulator n=1 Tax=unclassified Streptomyces TaxID=2593676 RepID=UPI0036E64643
MLLDGPAAGASAPSRRKRRARGAQRISRIVDVAEELVTAAGVQAAGMNAIARRAGISPGSPYRCFPGKGAVVEEVSRHFAVRLQRAVRRVSHTGSPSTRPAPESTVDRLLEAALIVAREYPALPALLMATGPAELDALLQAVERGLPGRRQPRTRHSRIARRR